MSQVTANTVFHSGKVKDQNGIPLVGAHIVSDTSPKRGTISDFDGNFQVSGNVGVTWTIGHIGKKSVSIILKKGMPAATYILEDEGIELDGVTVTAPKKKQNYLLGLLALTGLLFASKSIFK